MTNFTELKQAIQEMREAGVPELDGILDSHVGICATCSHIEDCTYLQNATSAIHHCEEFDTYVEPSIPEPNVHAYSTGTRKSDQANVKGLCRNCAKHESCTYHQPESGIWHCEEYE